MLTTLYTNHPDIDAWPKAMCKLGEENMWFAVRIFCIGTDDLPPLLTNINLKCMDISNLLALAGESCNLKWAPRLALVLLQMGAVFKTDKLPSKDKVKVLGQALDIGIKTSMINLFVIKSIYFVLQSIHFCYSINLFCCMIS